MALIDPATHAYPALQLPSQEGDVRPPTDPYRPEPQTSLQLAFGLATVAPYRPGDLSMPTYVPVKLSPHPGHTGTVGVWGPEAAT